MSRRTRREQFAERKHHIARITRKRLKLLIFGLLLVLAFFIFQPWADFWPDWMFDIRRGVIVLGGLMTILLILMSPIIVATESDPRPLSGPGKNPRDGVFNSWKPND